MKRTFFWIAGACIVVIGGLLFIPRADAPVVVEDTISLTMQEQAQGKLSPEMASTATEMIEVTAPIPNSTLTSPLTITGRARGPWYFEASFPIELRDANNVLIAKTVAQAQGEWMTENFVPFTATLTFPTQPAGSQGVLTLKNDNPSGEPERDMMFDVAVTF